MQAAFTALDGWLLRTTLGGGIVLLVGALWMLISRQPEKRQRLGELALLFALIVALPAALPAWWSIPGSIRHDSLTTPTPGCGPRDALGTDEGAGELSFTEDLESDFTVELWHLLGILNEQNEPMVVNTQAPDEFVHQSNPQEQDTSSSVAALLGGGDTPWFHWGLRAYGVVYVAFVLFLLSRCGLGYFGLWRYWRNRRPAPAHVHASLAELEPDEVRRPRIGVCPYVHGPVSYGLWKPTILLPPAFCNEGDPEKLRWILAHELTHLRRRDAWGCLLLALGGSVYFHLPWFWWLRRQVRLAQEYVADAAAAKIASAVDYAQYLVSLTSLTARPSLASGRAAGVFESQSDLYRRVHMLLRQRNVVEGGAPRWWTLSAAASFLALAACTAGVKVRADEPEKKQVTVTVVTDDDDDKAAEKKKATEKKNAARVEFKIDDKDAKEGKAKTHVFEFKDGKFVPAEGKGKEGVAKWAYVLDGEKQKLDEVMKKLDQVIAKLPKGEPETRETRAKLEEVKALLKKMQSSSSTSTWTPKVEVVPGKGADAKRLEENRARASQERDRASQAEREARARSGDAEARGRALEQEARARVREQEARARQVEREARAAADKAMARWKESKDGKDREAAVKDLEKAIAEKEAQIKKLKQGGGEGDREALMKKLREAEGERASQVKGAREAEEVYKRNIVRLQQLKKAQDEKAKGSGAPAQRGRLGVMLSEVEDDAREEAKIAEGQGVLINEVIEGSAAWNQGKGLKAGDVLVEFGGKKVKSDLGAFVKAVGEMKEGTYNAVVYRNGKRVNVTGIKLGARDEKPAKRGDDDDVSFNRVKLGDADVILNLNDEVAKMNKVHGDVVLKLSDATKGLKDVKGELAVELDGVRKNLDTLKGDLTLRLADLKSDDLRKHVDGLVTLKLGDAVKQGIVVKPEVVLDANKALDKVKLDGVKVAPKVEHLIKAKIADAKGQVKDLPLTLVVDDARGKVRLGVQTESVPEELSTQVDLADDRGVYVREVVAGSAAEKAGIQKKDIIIELANKPVARDPEKFAAIVKGLKPGNYTATVIRKGKEMRIRNIVLAEASKDDAKSKKDWMVEDEKEKTKSKDEAKKGAAKAKEKEDSFGRRTPNFGNFGGGRNVNRNNSISINDGEFTAKSVVDGDKTITVVGRLEDGKAAPRSITIKTGDEEKKYKSLKEVPEADKEDVENLVKNIRGSGNVIRFAPQGGFNFGPGFGAGGNFGPQLDAQMKLLEEHMKKMREQMGRGNPGFEEVEKQLEEMRKQLRDLRKKDKDDDQK